MSNVRKIGYYIFSKDEKYFLTRQGFSDLQYYSGKSVSVTCGVLVGLEEKQLHTVGFLPMALTGGFSPAVSGTRCGVPILIITECIFPMDVALHWLCMTLDVSGEDMWKYT